MHYLPLSLEEMTICSRLPARFQKKPIPIGAPKSLNEDTQDDERSETSVDDRQAPPVNEQQPETGDSVAEADPNRQGRREGSRPGTANLATRDSKAGSSSIMAGSTSPLNSAHIEIGSRSPALTAPFSRLPDGANGQT